MLQIWLWVFVGINLLIRLPIRIAIRGFKVQNEKLETYDLIATLAATFCFIGLCINALATGKVSTGLAVACIVLFGGIFLLITGASLYVKFKEIIEKKKK